MARHGDQRAAQFVGHMSDKPSLAATGRPFQHHRHLALRSNRKEADFTMHLGVERLPVDAEGMDIEFSSWLTHVISTLKLREWRTINGTTGEDQAMRPV